MQIRPMVPADLERLGDIDGTIESDRYLHVEREGDGLTVGWRVEERPLRTPHIARNALSDDLWFRVKQIVSGIEEGLVWVAEHDRALVGLVVAQAVPAEGVLRIFDLRIDSDFRRQGVGSALLYRVIGEAREKQLRAVMATTEANNLPAGRFLLKSGFELSGLNTRQQSNHDLVKECVTMFWYLAMS